MTTYSHILTVKGFHQGRFTVSTGCIFDERWVPIHTRIWTCKVQSALFRGKYHIASYKWSLGQWYQLAQFNPFFLGRSCHFWHSFSHFHSVSRSILLLVFIPPLTKSLILSLCHFLCQHGIKSSSLPKALMKLIIWTLERQLRKSDDVLDDQLQYWW